jgi:hypothetical protein
MADIEHRRQVVQRVERQRRKDERVDDEVSRRDETKHIAIRRRLGDEVDAEVPAGARPVLHDHWLAKTLSQSGRQKAR